MTALQFKDLAALWNKNEIIMGPRYSCFISPVTMPCRVGDTTPVNTFIKYKHISDELCGVVWKTVD
jgi:hypothetical protein